jgi:hypothetical protein
MFGRGLFHIRGTMLYAFDAQDVQRLRRLLLAYERGAIRLEGPRQYAPPGSRQDTFLAHVTVAIPAGQTGSANLVSVDDTTPTPVLTDLTDLSSFFTVLNPYSAVLNPGYYVIAREPTRGYYVPANVLASVNFSGCRYYGDGGLQSVPNNTYTNVSFNGLNDYDTDNYTKALNVPVQGYYRGYFQVEFSAGSSGFQVGLVAYGSNAVQYGQVQCWVAPNQSDIVQVVFEGHFPAASHLFCQAFQNSGATLQVNPELAVMSLILIPGGTLSSEGL